MQGHLFFCLKKLDLAVDHGHLLGGSFRPGMRNLTKRRMCFSASCLTRMSLHRFRAQSFGHFKESNGTHRGALSTTLGL